MWKITHETLGLLVSDLLKIKFKRLSLLKFHDKIIVFLEFWEDHFQCKYPNSSSTPSNVNYSKMCTKTEKLTYADTFFEAQLQFVSDAVMAFAYALR